MKDIQGIFNTYEHEKIIRMIAKNKPPASINPLIIISHILPCKAIDCTVRFYPCSHIPPAAIQISGLRR